MKKWLEKVDWIYVIVPLALLGTFWVIAHLPDNGLGRVIHIIHMPCRRIRG